MKGEKRQRNPKKELQEIPESDSSISKSTHGGNETPLIGKKKGRPLKKLEEKPDRYDPFNFSACVDMCSDTPGKFSESLE